MSNSKWLMVAILSIAGVAGCNQADNKVGSEPAVAEAETHEHGEWWCDEHGVPEEICAQCNSKLIADFKAKDDWCKQHDRPESQCFICHPELEAKFAAQYEAKYGKRPPKPEM